MKKITDAMLKENEYCIKSDLWTALNNGWLHKLDDLDTRSCEYYFLRDGDYSREKLILLYLAVEDRLEEMKVRCK